MPESINHLVIGKLLQPQIRSRLAANRTRVVGCCGSQPLIVRIHYVIARQGNNRCVGILGRSMACKYDVVLHENLFVYSFT